MRKKLLEYRKVILIMILIAMISSLLMACSKSKEATVSTSPTPMNNKVRGKVISATVKPAQKGSLINYVTLVGEVKANKSVSIVPKTQEKVKELYVEIGDRVKKGDKLVILDNNFALIQVQQAAASLKVAKANSQQTLNGAKEEEILQLEANLASAKSSYQQAKKNYERQKDLFDQRVISSQTLEEVENNYITAKSKYQSAKYSLKSAKDGATQEEIKALEGQVAQAEASLKSAKLELNKTIITAPIDGIVSSVDIEEGEIVSSNLEVMTISNIDKIRLLTYVSQNNIDKIRVGEEVEVNFKVLNNRFSGKIKSISPVADRTKKSYPVEILIDNQNNIIKAGMYAKVTLKTDQVNESIIIPQNSVLVDDNGNSYTYIAEIRNSKIGFVFQSFNLLARDSILYNVETPLIYAGAKKKERRRRAVDLLNKVGLGDRLDHKPNEISGGQKQRVAVARSLVNNPSLILADEPTGNLDSKTEAEIINLFHELNSQGHTIVIVTHSEEVAQQTNRIIHILDGELVKDEVIVR